MTSVVDKMGYVVC